MNLDDSVAPNKYRHHYPPEPQVRWNSWARYKAERQHHTPNNLLRYYGTSRYTIQSQGSGSKWRNRFGPESTNLLGQRQGTLSLGYLLSKDPHCRLAARSQTSPGCELPSLEQASPGFHQWIQ